MLVPRERLCTVLLQPLHSPRTTTPPRDGDCLHSRDWLSRDPRRRLSACAALAGVSGLRPAGALRAVLAARVAPRPRPGADALHSHARLPPLAPTPTQLPAGTASALGGALAARQAARRRGTGASG